MDRLTALKQRFSEAPGWHFSQTHAGFPLLHLTNPQAEATVSLYGAQMLSFRPRGEEDLFWLSRDARFTTGRSIRGGVPLCWPWFGPHPGHSQQPAHGFARTRFWQLTALESSDEGSMVSLELPLDDQSPSVSLTLNITRTLRASLTTHNRTAAAITISAAFHSYFAISDISEIHITGLEDKPFRDAVNDNRACLQRGPIRFSAELDRVYQAVDSDILIHDPEMERTIRLAAEGSRSAVVWNPWAEKSARLGDMGPDGFRSMVCVETANADQDARHLAPGQSHTLSAIIGIDKDSL